MNSNPPGLDAPLPPERVSLELGAIDRACIELGMDLEEFARVSGLEIKFLARVNGGGEVKVGAIVKVMRSLNTCARRRRRQLTGRKGKYPFPGTPEDVLRFLGRGDF